MREILMTERSDSDLLAEYAMARSEDIYAELVRRHTQMVYRTCLRSTMSQHDAEDATQAVMLVLFEHPERAKIPVGAWLHGLARSTAGNLRRGQARRQAREQVAFNCKDSPIGEREAADLREELDQALQRLPDRLREAVLLRYLEGRDQEEAARLAGCPRGTLARRASEGLEQLRQLLARRGLTVTGVLLTSLLAKEAAAASAAIKVGAGASATAAAAKAAHEASAVGFASLKTWLGAGALAATLAVVVVTSNRDGPIRLEGHKKPVVNLAFSSDGRFLASAEEFGEVRLWDPATGHTLRTFTDVGQPVAIALSDTHIAAAGHDTKLVLWKRSTGEKVLTRDDPSPIYALAFSPNQKTLAYTGVNRGVVRIDLATGNDVRGLSGDGKAQVQHGAMPKGYTGWGNSLAYSPRGDTIAFGGWQLDNLKRTAMIYRHRVLKDGAHFWGLRDSLRPDGVGRPSPDAIGEVAFVTYGRTILPHPIDDEQEGEPRYLTAVGVRGVALVWEHTRGGAQVRLRREGIRARFGAPTLVFLRDDRWIAFVTNAGAIEIIDLVGGQVAASFGGELKPNTLAASPDGQRLAVGCEDGAIHVFPLSGLLRD